MQDLEAQAVQLQAEIVAGTEEAANAAAACAAADARVHGLEAAIALEQRARVRLRTSTRCTSRGVLRLLPGRHMKEQ